MRFIKIFGAEMSGTSFLAESIKISFDVRVLVNEFGWVHGLPIKPEYWIDSPLCKDREEFSRILECHKWIYFAVIVRNPYEWYHVSQKAFTHWEIDKAYQKFTKLYLGYERMLMGGHPFFSRGVMVKFENLRRNPDLTLEPFTKILGFKRKEGAKRINPPHTENTGKIPQSDLDIINTILPDELFLMYGYDRIINTKDL